MSCCDYYLIFFSTFLSLPSFTREVIPGFPIYALIPLGEASAHGKHVWAERGLTLIARAVWRHLEAWRSPWKQPAIFVFLHTCAGIRHVGLAIQANKKLELHCHRPTPSADHTTDLRDTRIVTDNMPASSR